MRNFFKKLRSDSWSKYFSKTVQRVGKNNAGFSLVELIVVIAIMAVLAAVAVIGVSIYIPKAQKAADQTMISDIKTAIDMSAQLQGGLDEEYVGKSGYIVIHRDGAPTGGNVTVSGYLNSFITNTLKDTFGENYGSKLKVSYQEYSGGLTGIDLEHISGSTYIKNTADLLDKIQILTDSVVGFGLPQDQANEMTMSVAEKTIGMTDDQKEAFVSDWWCKIDPSNPASGAYSFGSVPSSIGLDNVSMMAAWYARLESAVLYVQTNTGCSEINTVFTTASNGIGTEATNSDVTTAINNVWYAVANHCTQHGEVCGAKFMEYVNNPDGQMRTDAYAYIALLKQVDNLSDELIEEIGADSPDFYNSEYLVNKINGYTNSVDAFNNQGAKDGDLVIVITIDKEGMPVYSVYPLDY